MISLSFSPNKYLVIIQSTKYPNIYTLSNKLNGFLQNRSNYFKLSKTEKKAYYIFETLAEVKSFYRNATSTYTGLLYSYITMKTGKLTQL